MPEAAMPRAEMNGDSPMTLFEAVEVTAAWSFLSDPVPPAALEQVLGAATRGPSGANLQPWRFVVVREPARRQEIAALYADAWARYASATTRVAGQLLGRNGARGLATGAHLAHTLADVPVLIVVCMAGPPRQLQLRDEHGQLLDAGSLYASVFPAVQNLMLAATALGPAIRLTTVHRIREAELKACLGIPDDIETVALVPLGYPAFRHRRRPRLPLRRVVFWDGWRGARR